MEKQGGARPSWIRKEGYMRMENANVQAIPAAKYVNLSDFALFLSVMKNKEAHEIVLRIIMENPQLKLEEVHVEEVILNKSGKRAIRLDAWAKDSAGVQYNTEMQNDAERDDVRKRSRFYQGLMDVPILKSGKNTKYKQLPSTVIIFITQDDIFGQDLAKYTFTEQCEEVEGLHLDDGTTKIFLNMTSKNGDPELISLLQYMKETRLSNPEILVQDEQIRKLDHIVNEVRESEEWEAVRMSIFSIAHEQGMAQGIAEGKAQGMAQGKTAGQEFSKIQLVCRKLRRGKNVEVIADELEEEIVNIQKICTFAERFAPEYDENQVFDAWMKEVFHI